MDFSPDAFVCGYLSKAPQPYARELADAFLKAYQKAHPKDTLDIVRLAEADVHCVRGEELEHREALKREGKVDAPEFAEARRFAAADGIVIAAPMWELSFPAMLKAYIETVSRTRRYVPIWRRRYRLCRLL